MAAQQVEKVRYLTPNTPQPEPAQHLHLRPNRARIIVEDPVPSDKRRRYAHKGVMLRIARPRRDVVQERAALVRCAVGDSDAAARGCGVAQRLAFLDGWDRESLDRAAARHATWVLLYSMYPCGCGRGIGGCGGGVVVT